PADAAGALQRPGGTGLVVDGGTVAEVERAGHGGGAEIVQRAVEETRGRRERRRRAGRYGQAAPQVGDAGKADGGVAAHGPARPRRRAGPGVGGGAGQPAGDERQRGERGGAVAVDGVEEDRVAAAGDADGGVADEDGAGQREAAADVHPAAVEAE